MNKQDISNKPLSMEMDITDDTITCSYLYPYHSDEYQQDYKRLNIKLLVRKIGEVLSKNINISDINSFMESYNKTTDYVYIITIDNNTWHIGYNGNGKWIHYITTGDTYDVILELNIDQLALIEFHKSMTEFIKQVIEKINIKK
jgi:hypothetical protein